MKTRSRFFKANSLSIGGITHNAHFKRFNTRAIFFAGREKNSSGKTNRDILLIDHSSLMPTAVWHIEIILQCSGIREKIYYYI